MVARSGIPGAGLGLYACSYKLLTPAYLAQTTPREPPTVVATERVFRRRELIGHFAGELIDEQEYVVALAKAVSPRSPQVREALQAFQWLCRLCARLDADAES